MATENVFLSPELLSDEELGDMLDGEWPVYMDDEYAFYYVDHKIVVAPVSFVCDTAVREAGFATEDLRHCIEELMTLLYVRMLESGVRGFTMREWEAIDRACDLLGIDRKHRAAQKG